MAAAMAMQPLAPRPSPHHLSAWSPPNRLYMDGKENRPALPKSVNQSSTPARPRRERPCDGCRRRKSKCVIQESRRCVLCEFHKQECTFIENAQPRKRKVDDISKATEHSRKASITTTTTSSTSRSSPVQQASLPQSTSISTSTASVPNPFTVDESLSLQRRFHCKYLGHTTALDASLIGLNSFSDKHETSSQLGTLRQVVEGEYFSIHADADVPIPDDEVRALAEIDATVGQHAPALIDLYFRNVHPSYPILQKKTFMDRHSHGDRHFNPPLLAAMYLLALNWWHREPELAQHPKPDMEKLEYIAFSSLMAAMQRPKISAVQAGLLLLQRAKSSRWTLTVQLVALGQDIGLHLDCSDWSIPIWERRLRKRLAWALYMQDKWSAMMHGRPSHINAADWAVQPPSEDDFDESLAAESEEASTEILRGRNLFIHMISLTSIMAEVCSTFYSETAKAEYAEAGRYATQLVLNRAKPVQIRLKDWFAKLPAECKMDAPLINGQLSSTGYLHLGYFATEISIHRRIVQSLDAATADPYMLYICRSAAKTRLISAMESVNRLRPEHLNSFWYFASASNFALIGTFGAMLMATSPHKEEAEFYAARLQEFKWTLHVSAQKAAWIGSAAETLEANLEMLRGLEDKEPVGTKRVRVVDPAVAGRARMQEEQHQRNGQFEEEGDDDEDDDVEMDGWDESYE